MVIPIIVLVAIPIFLGIVYMPPFEPPEPPQGVEPKPIGEKPDLTILYIILMGIWMFFLLRIILKLRKGTFRATQRY